MNAIAGTSALMHLIPSRRDQSERIEVKRDAILRWLAEETFTTSKVLESLLGLQKNAIHKTLSAMIRDQLVDVHELQWLDFRFRLFVLTPHGAALAGRPGAYFQKGRIAESAIAHALDVQRVRLQAERAGWSDWQAERSLRAAAEQEKRDKTPEADRLWLKVPDSVAVAPHQGRVAIEIERTIKTSKTYEFVMGQYLQMVKRGAVSRICYLTKSEKVAVALRETFMKISTVPIAGRRFPLGPEHYRRFSFHSMDAPETWAVATEQVALAGGA